MPPARLYAFGYALSCTTFSYESISCEKTGPAEVRVSVKVSNTGDRDGDEVVQVYVTDPLASTVRPRLQLRAFERVFVEAGGSRTVEFTLGEDAFALYNLQMEKVVEPGEFIIQAGPSSDNLILKQTITL